jgi:hypothetical protein
VAGRIGAGRVRHKQQRGDIVEVLRNTMSYEAHREICAKERAETNKALNQLFDAQKDAHGMIKEIHGYLKAKNGGGL